MIDIQEFKINNVDYTDYVTYPVQMQKTLDGGIGIAYVELKSLPQGIPFKPLYDVIFKINDTTYKYEISSNTIKEVIENNKYNYDILLIEDTKEAERYFVEKTIRQPVIHDYLSTQQGVQVLREKQGLSDTFFTYDNIKSPQLYSPNLEIYIPSAYDFYHEQSFLDGGAYFIVYKDSVEIYRTTKSGDDYTISLTNNNLSTGIYTIEYKGTGVDTSKYLNYTFEIQVLSQYYKSDYTIKDVLEKLIQSSELLRESENTYFTLAEVSDYPNDQQDKINKIFNTISPEFTFTKQSLLEALRVIGSYAHFEPYIENRKIYLKLLGSTEKSSINEEDYCSNISSLNIDNFCNKLDSFVNNLVSQNKNEEHTITEPFDKGYKTLRTEVGTVQISDTNIKIPTEYGINRIFKLEFGYLSDDTYIGDITSFVYTEDEYNQLSSYDNKYPNSKMYAIKYTIGEKDITGLTFKRENIISSTLENIAIQNIVYKKVGKPINWWTNFWSTENPLKFQYRIVYEPVIDARVTQSKDFTEDIDKINAIAYNQSASKIDSVAYGENLKGTIAKLGNIEKNVIYILSDINQIPKAGTKFDDDYYITIVKTEIYKNFIKCELGLSKNYNNKSAYVQINNDITLFEYNRNNVIDTNLIREDYCEIGNFNETDNKSLITDNGLIAFSSVFNNTDTPNEVTVVETEGFNSSNESLGSFVLPVVSVGLGNSILFNFKYFDSVTVGDAVVTRNNTRYQNPLTYTDVWGEVSKLKLGYGYSTTEINNYNDAVTIGDLVPDVTNNITINKYFDTGNDKLLIDKGVADVPHISYQIHFVSNKNNIIIGSALSRTSKFVSNNSKNYKLYILNNEIDKFTDKINLTNSTEYGTISISNNTANKSFKIEDIIANANGKAWAIVDTNTNALIIGENINIISGNTVSMPYFVFKHKL